MKQIRQLTKRGDPMVRVKLPAVVVRMLESCAKKNKRRTQDQFIKGVADTFKNEEAFTIVSERFVPDLTEVYQLNNKKGE